MPQAFAEAYEYGCVASTILTFALVSYLVLSSPDTRSKVCGLGDGNFNFDKICAVHITHDSRGWGPRVFGCIRLLFGSIAVGSTLIRIFVIGNEDMASPTLEVFVFWNWFGLGIWLMVVGIASLTASTDPASADSGTLFYRLAWVSQQVLSAAVIYIFLIVWCLLVPLSLREFGWNDSTDDDGKVVNGTRTLIFNPISWMAHDLATIFVLFEFYANRTVFVRAHGLFAIIFSNLYVVASWFIYWSTGKFWYAFMDFTRLGWLTIFSYIGLNLGQYGMMTVTAKLEACLKKGVSKNLLPNVDGTSPEQESFAMS